MSEIARVISNHYGVKVKLADSSISGKTISGVMPNDNLEVLVAALEATGEFKISQADHELTITGL